MPRDTSPNTGCLVPSCTNPKCKDPAHGPATSTSTPAAPARRSRGDALEQLDLEERIALELFVGNGNLAEAFAEAEKFVETMRLRRKRKDKPLLEQIAKESGDAS